MAGIEKYSWDGKGAMYQESILRTAKQAVSYPQWQKRGRLGVNMIMPATPKAVCEIAQYILIILYCLRINRNM